jgi:hypothetical protein
MTFRFLPDAERLDRHPREGTVIGDRVGDGIRAEGQPSHSLDRPTVSSLHRLDPLEEKAPHKHHCLGPEGDLLTIDVVPALSAGRQGKDRGVAILERMLNQQRQKPFARLLHGVRIHERLTGCPAGFSVQSRVWRREGFWKRRSSLFVWLDGGWR